MSSNDGQIYEFDNGLVLNMNEYPPAPVIWLTTSIDMICNVLQCHNWRNYLNDSDDNNSWFNEKYKVPSVSSQLPNLLSYTEFCNIDNDNTNMCINTPIKAFYKYAFHTSSTDIGSLNNIKSILILILLVLILRQIKSIVMPLFSNIGRNVAIQTHGIKWINENEIRIMKFGEYVFRLLYHTLISIYEIYYFLNKEWWLPNRTILIFQGFPYHDIEPGMAWYYLIQSAYNVDAFISLIELSFIIEFRPIFIKNKASTKGNNNNNKSLLQIPIVIKWSETVRGDFQEMLIHHIATNVLVFGSSILRLTRAGSMVFLVHDVSDVPVDLSKLANFLKWKVTTIICFGVMTIMWMYTRLYILPIQIFYTVLYKSHYALEEGLSPIIYICYKYFFYFFLGLLILLHATWFLMFLRIFHTLIVKRECHDYSEHKYGEKQDDDDNNNGSTFYNNNNNKNNSNTNGVTINGEKKEQ